MRSRQSRVYGMTLLLILAGVSHAAYAMYKCPQSVGSYAYQETPCDGGMEMPPVRDPVPDSPAPGRNVAIPLQPPAPITPQPAPQPFPSGAKEPGPTDVAMGQLTNIFDTIFGALYYHLVIGGIGGTFIGYWASYRNRSFWNWFWLCVAFNPGVIFWFFLFRGEDPIRPDYKSLRLKD